MIVLKFLLFYLLSHAEVRADDHATCTNSTSNLPGHVENIKQRIWDHSIFDIVFAFIRNDLPSLEDQISHNNLGECGSSSSTCSVVGDCDSTSTATVSEVPIYSVACNSVALPATGPLASDVGMFSSSSQSALT
jgi:hypothetical protein